MNVLSLFDGISCGQLALQRAGIVYNKYFASEIDKYPIAVTQHRFPDTMQLGDIKNWKDWNLPHIDMIIGGSPCQGFSSAGKGLNFDDPRSKLFFYFMDIVNHYKPKYFMLENVKMKREWQDIISDFMGVQPILIDSALVSAQSRKRLYWTNISNVTQPKDKNVKISDIVEWELLPNKDVLHPLSKTTKEHIENGVCFIPCALRANRKYLDNRRYYESSDLNKSNTVTSNFYDKDNRLLFVTNDGLRYRKLSVLEYERLQTIPDNYTLVPHPHFHGKMMSDSRRYMMIGNAWTVDIIAHIFSFIERGNGR